MVTASDGDCYPSSPMRLVHRHTFINALPKSSPRGIRDKEGLM
nr:hypothetical protein [Ruminococcus bromii]